MNASFETLIPQLKHHIPSGSTARSDDSLDNSLEDAVRSFIDFCQQSSPRDAFNSVIGYNLPQQPPPQQPYQLQQQPQQPQYQLQPPQQPQPPYAPQQSQNTLQQESISQQEELQEALRELKTLQNAFETRKAMTSLPTSNVARVELSLKKDTESVDTKDIAGKVTKFFSNAEHVSCTVSGKTLTIDVYFSGTDDVVTKKLQKILGNQKAASKALQLEIDRVKPVTVFYGLQTLKERIDELEGRDENEDVKPVNAAPRLPTSNFARVELIMRKSAVESVETDEIAQKVGAFFGKRKQVSCTVSGNTLTIDVYFSGTDDTVKRTLMNKLGTKRKASDSLGIEIDRDPSVSVFDGLETLKKGFENLNDRVVALADRDEGDKSTTSAPQLPTSNFARVELIMRQSAVESVETDEIAQKVGAFFGNKKQVSCTVSGKTLTIDVYFSGTDDAVKKTLTNRLGTKEKASSALGIEIDKVQSVTVFDGLQTLSNHVSQLKEDQEEMAKQRAEYDSMKKQLDDLELKLKADEEKPQSDAVAEAVAAAEAAAASAKAAASAESSLVDAKNTIETIKNEALAQLRAEEEALKTRLTASEGETTPTVGGDDARVAELQKRIEELQESRAQAQTETARELQELHELLNEQKTQMAALKNGEAPATVEGETPAVTVDDERVAQLETQMEELQNSRAQAETELERRLQELLEAQREEMQALQKDEAPSTVEGAPAVDARVAELQIQVQELGQLLEAQKEEMQVLQKDEAPATVEGDEPAVTVDARVAELENQLQELGQLLEAQKEEMQALQKGEAPSTVGDAPEVTVDARVAELENQLQELRQLLEAQKTQVAALENGEATSAVGVVDARVAQLETQMEKLQNSRDKSAKANADDSSDSSSDEEEVSGRHTAARAMKDEVDSLKEAIARQETQNTSATEHLNALRENEKALQSQVTQLQESLEDIAGKMQSLATQRSVEDESEMGVVEEEQELIQEKEGQPIVDETISDVAQRFYIKLLRGIKSRNERVLKEAIDEANASAEERVRALQEQIKALEKEKRNQEQGELQQILDNTKQQQQSLDALKGVINQQFANILKQAAVDKDGAEQAERKLGDVFGDAMQIIEKLREPGSTEPSQNDLTPSEEAITRKGDEQEKPRQVEEATRDEQKEDTTRANSLAHQFLLRLLRNAKKKTEAKLHSEIDARKVAMAERILSLQKDNKEQSNSTAEEVRELQKQYSEMVTMWDKLATEMSEKMEQMLSELATKMVSTDNIKTVESLARSKLGNLLNDAVRTMREEGEIGTQQAVLQEKDDALPAQDSAREISSPTRDQADSGALEIPRLNADSLVDGQETTDEEVESRAKSKLGNLLNDAVRTMREEGEIGTQQAVSQQISSRTQDEADSDAFDTPRSNVDSSVDEAIDEEVQSISPALTREKIQFMLQPGVPPPSRSHLEPFPTQQGLELLEKSAFDEEEDANSLIKLQHDKVQLETQTVELEQKLQTESNRSKVASLDISLKENRDKLKNIEQLIEKMDADMKRHARKILDMYDSSSSREEEKIAQQSDEENELFLENAAQRLQEELQRTRAKTHSSDEQLVELVSQLKKLKTTTNEDPDFHALRVEEEIRRRKSIHEKFHDLFIYLFTVEADDRMIKDLTTGALEGISLRTLPPEDPTQLQYALDKVIQMFGASSDRLLKLNAARLQRDLKKNQAAFLAHVRKEVFASDKRLRESDHLKHIMSQLDDAFRKAGIRAPRIPQRAFLSESASDQWFDSRIEEYSIKESMA